MGTRMNKLSPTATNNCQYPNTFNLYRPSLKHPHTYVLGQHENQPVYAVTTNTVFSSQPDVVLHGGPGEENHVTASYNIKRFSLDRFVELAPLLSGGNGSSSAIERVRRSFRTFSFEVEVGSADGRLRRERFEWRRTRGSDFPGVGLKLFGHKLVRLGGGGGDGPRASDGGEIVALCSGPGSAYTGSKVFKFEFVGSGASGGLGERWATMAVITGLGQWMEDVRRRLFLVYILVCVI